MRLHIEATHTPLEPLLVEWIVEGLKDLNTPHEDIMEAQIVFRKVNRQQEVRIILSLAHGTFQVTRRGANRHSAVHGAMQKMLQTVHNFRARQLPTSVPASSPYTAWGTYRPRVAEEA